MHKYLKNYKLQQNKKIMPCEHSAIFSLFSKFISLFTEKQKDFIRIV